MGRAVVAVIHVTMNDASLSRRIAEIAGDSSRVVPSPHAKNRMRMRKILLTQVLHCLRRGKVIEHAHVDIHGCWKCTLEAVSAGDRIKVAAAVSKDEIGEYVVVITVMN